MKNLSPGRLGMLTKQVTGQPAPVSRKIESKLCGAIPRT